MSTDSPAVAPSGADAPGAPPAARGIVLAAVDGSVASDGALVAAALIAGATGAPIEVVSAVEPMSYPLGEVVLPRQEIEQALEAERRMLAESQVRGQTGPEEPWPIHVMVGRPADVVSRVARARAAALVVTAFGRHGILARVLGTETPLRIARVCDVPVLCVSPDVARLPHVAVVAIDFGDECLRAAAAARPLLEQATAVHLVHVRRNERLDLPSTTLAEWERLYDGQLDDAFARARRALALPPAVAVSTARLRGDAAPQVLEYAASVHAELLVAGHGHRGPLERLFGGSVASRLFRGAQCALLLAPDAPPALRLGLPGASTVELTDRARWLDELARFTEHNAGRLAMLEIDDTELGSQVVARGIAFRGADYDWHGDAIELTFGGSGPAGAHLAHVIRGATSIAVQHGREADRVLRVGHDHGQALLSFPPAR